VTQTGAPRFSAWLDEFFDSYFRRRPVNASFVGLHTFDDTLPDLSDAGPSATDALLDRLTSLPDEPLTPSETLDRQLAEGFLRIERWELTSPHFARNNPTLFTGEAIFGVISLLLRHDLPFEDRLRSAQPRLALIPDFLETAAQQLESAPAAWIARARRECTGAQLLFQDLQQPEAEQAFARFDVFLETSVRPTDMYACGAEAFALLLREGHFLDLSVDSLEQLAFQRLNSSDPADRDSPPGSGPSTKHSVVKESSSPGRVSIPPAPTVEDEYLSHIQSTWDAARNLTRDHNLLTFPDWPVHYTYTPEWAQRAAAYLYFLPYRSPQPVDPPTTVEYYAPRGADDATIKLNHVVHHGSFGHHVQNWHAARAASRIGRIAAVDCASRIAMLCGGTMAEGWACYATDLADEAGFLTNSEQQAQRQTRRRMAARALVDIRLHHSQLSLDEAAAFYVEHIGMSESAARAEAVKNGLFPGTACMYLAGWEAIRDLRGEMESRQPTTFSPRAFHDQLLSFGSVPVSLIARAMLAQTQPAVANA
jgi:Bacterial protein of unknown function (DUF885)